MLLPARRLPLLVLLVPIALIAGRRTPPPEVAANDNRTPAGTLTNGVLTLDLVAMVARWCPEAKDGPAVEVAVLAEANGPPAIPSPTIRVPAGTEIVATIRNTLDSTLYVHGMVTRPQAKAEPIVIAPGEKRTIRFLAGEPGTYAYSATPGVVDYDVRERETMVGAFVVDEPGGRTDDRIFVINIWGEPKDSTRYRNALAINGRAWPHNERIEATVGDTLHWRVVNGSIRNHPMHLHGYYFDLLARGGVLADTALAAPALAVTEQLTAFGTMRLRFVAERPGNWLFHCHLAFHVVPEDARLDELDAHAAHSGDAGKHMAGLVVGIAVAPTPGWRDPERLGPRRVHLYVNEGARRRLAPRSLGYVVQRGDRAPAADSVEIPGSVLALTRDEPTDIVVHNGLGEATAVHWHGIELESWSDGVAGWSGQGRRLAPPIAPADSFVARLTLPRAGTFIYHTHMNDIEQLTSGLYGAIVVTEPGQPFDARTDHVFVAGWDGTADDGQRRIVNGGKGELEPPIETRVGVAHRLRFVNIGPADMVGWEIQGADSTVARWTPLAKDGADLPAARRIEGRAFRVIAVGETFDAEFVPPEPGEYRLLALGEPLGRRFLNYQRRFIVRP
jgi:FtsP/CotA-like multicopper oxidase with cupredoxin domain